MSAFPDIPLVSKTSQFSCDAAHGDRNTYGYDGRQVSPKGGRFVVQFNGHSMMACPSSVNDVDVATLSHGTLRSMMRPVASGDNTPGQMAGLMNYNDQSLDLIGSSKSGEIVATVRHSVDFSFVFTTVSGDKKIYCIQKDPLGVVNECTKLEIVYSEMEEEYTAASKDMICGYINSQAITADDRTFVCYTACSAGLPGATGSAPVTYADLEDFRPLMVVSGPSAVVVIPTDNTDVKACITPSSSNSNADPQCNSIVNNADEVNIPVKQMIDAYSSNDLWLFIPRDEKINVPICGIVFEGTGNLKTIQLQFAETFKTKPIRTVKPIKHGFMVGVEDLTAGTNGNGWGIIFITCWNAAATMACSITDHSTKLSPRWYPETIVKSNPFSTLVLISHTDHNHNGVTELYQFTNEIIYKEFPTTSYAISVHKSTTLGDKYFQSYDDETTGGDHISDVAPGYGTSAFGLTSDHVFVINAEASHFLNDNTMFIVLTNVKPTVPEDIAFVACSDQYKFSNAEIGKEGWQYNGDGYSRCPWFGYHEKKTTQFDNTIGQMIPYINTGTSARYTPRSPNYAVRTLLHQAAANPTLEVHYKDENDKHYFAKCVMQKIDNTLFSNKGVKIPTITCDSYYQSFPTPQNYHYAVLGEYPEISFFHNFELGSSSFVSSYDPHGGSFDDKCAEVHPHSGFCISTNEDCETGIECCSSEECDLENDKCVNTAPAPPLVSTLPPPSPPPSPPLACDGTYCGGCSNEHNCITVPTDPGCTTHFTTTINDHPCSMCKWEPSGDSLPDCKPRHCTDVTDLDENSQLSDYDACFRCSSDKSHCEGKTDNKCTLSSPNSNELCVPSVCDGAHCFKCDTEDNCDLHDDCMYNNVKNECTASDCETNCTNCKTMDKCESNINIVCEWNGDDDDDGECIDRVSTTPTTTPTPTIAPVCSETDCSACLDIECGTVPVVSECSNHFGTDDNEVHPCIACKLESNNCIVRECTLTEITSYPDSCFMCSEGQCNNENLESKCTYDTTAGICVPSVCDDTHCPLCDDETSCESQTDANNEYTCGYDTSCTLRYCANKCKHCLTVDECRGEHTPATLECVWSDASCADAVCDGDHCDKCGSKEQCQHPDFCFYDSATTTCRKANCDQTHCEECGLDGCANLGQCTWTEDLACTESVCSTPDCSGCDQVKCENYPACEWQGAGNTHCRPKICNSESCGGCPTQTDCTKQQCAWTNDVCTDAPAMTAPSPESTKVAEIVGGVVAGVVAFAVLVLSVKHSFQSGLPQRTLKNDAQDPLLSGF